MSLYRFGYRSIRKLGARCVVGVDGERAVGRVRGLLLKLAVLLEVVEQFLRRVLRLLHVRLVEGVYAETPARERGREFPQEELFAEVVRVNQSPVDDGVARGFEGFQLRLYLAVELADGDGD